MSDSQQVNSQVNPHELPATILHRADSGGDGRTVEIRIMPWGQVANTPQGRESWERGAFAGVDPTTVTIESQRHGGTLVGRGETLEEREDAAYLTSRISRTPAGDELLTLIDDGVVTQASVSFKPTKTARRDGVLVRQAAELWRVAIVERGVFAGAGVLAVRSQEGSGMVDVVSTGDPMEPLGAASNDADVLIRSALQPIVGRLDKIDDRFVKLAAQAAVPAADARPESWETTSLGDLLLRAIGEPHERNEGDRPSDYARAIADAYRTLHDRALLDQITTDNPGLMPPAHLTDAVGIVSAARPTIEAFGGARSLPASGMEIDWPALVPLAGRAIAVQATEKTEVVSRIVKFSRETEAILTYAGASDISIQLIRRSSPSYRELYARVMLAEYARVTDDAFTDALVAGGTGSVDYDGSTDTTGALLRAALFTASVAIQRATGSPASVAVLSEDLYIKAGSLGVDPDAGPMNASAVSSARNLSISISGLTITLGNVDMAAATGIISNRQAAGWYEDGPFTLEANDAARLGVNVAYWGLGAGVVLIPDGVVLLTNEP